MTSAFPTGLYQLAILGDVQVQEREWLTQTLSEMIADFGLVLGDDVVVFDGATVATRDAGAAFAAVYFATTADAGADIDAAKALVADSVPVIPTVDAKGVFEDVPEVIRWANGVKRREDDPKMTELASAMLECVGLLPRQRRVFVSYRRTESRGAAVHLHDVLSARGFDVFLDTHSILPAQPFQDILWHRLVDSDVMVMLDTPTYFDKRWTRREIARARAKDIQVLRVIWPEHTPTRMTDLSETVYLDVTDLKAPEGPLSDAAADDIVLRVERLRSRSHASRHMAISGKLKADVLKIGGQVEAIGAHRAISLRLPSTQQVWAYPVVGIPTAETLNDIAEKAKRASQKETPILVYDEIGIHDAWNRHLLWLDDQIKSVRAVKVTTAGWTLAEFDEGME